MFADLIIISTSVFTSTQAAPISAAIVIKGQRILDVVSKSDWKNYINENTKIIDVGNRSIVPGFSDSHIHAYFGAAINSDYVCTELFSSTSEKQAVEIVKDYYKSHANIKRIVGMGWFPIQWGGKLPSKHSLDAAFPNIPVYLQSADGHTFWLNSKALQEAGYREDMVFTAGELQRDSNGELTGVIFEIEACAAAFEQAFSFEPEIGKRIQLDFFHELNKYGITSICDMSADPWIRGDYSNYEISKEIEKEGLLTVRINLYPSLGMDGNLAIPISLREKYCTDKLRVAGLKQFLDGVTSTYSAALSLPYSDNPKTSGYLAISEEKAYYLVNEAAINNFPVRLHSIGDLAVRIGIESIKRAKQNNPQWSVYNSLEHIESMNSEDIERMAISGIVAAVQPLHLIDDRNEKVSRIGVERCRYEWPFRSLEKAGVTLAFGTDYPVTHFNPLPNIYAAITRSDSEGNVIGINSKEEIISLQTALTAYTIGSAKSHNIEKQVGSITNGMFADLAILDRDIFSCAEEVIQNIEVYMTIFDGKIVFGKENN